MEILNALGIDPKMLVTQIVGFIILVALLKRLLYAPLFGVIDQRQADIKATYDQLDADRASMERTRREYEERLAGIENEARERIQAAIKEAQTLRDGIVADAQQQAEIIVQRGRNESERERQKAFLEMRQEIVELAVAAAGKLVGDSLDGPRQTKLVDDFIGGIGLTSNGYSASSGAAGEIAN
jgi:F-type H+-transporting ATPase subunit b